MNNNLITFITNATNESNIASLNSLTYKEINQKRINKCNEVGDLLKQFGAVALVKIFNVSLSEYFTLDEGDLTKENIEEVIKFLGK